MLAEAEAAETSEAVQPELWQLCRTLTGCTGDQLNDVYAHVDDLDTRATLLGLQQTLASGLHFPVCDRSVAFFSIRNHWDWDWSAKVV